MRGRGGQPTRGRGGQNMRGQSTPRGGGRISKNVGTRSNINIPDFGFKKPNYNANNSNGQSPAKRGNYNTNANRFGGNNANRFGGNNSTPNNQYSGNNTNRFGAANNATPNNYFGQSSPFGQNQGYNSNANNQTGYNNRPGGQNFNNSVPDYTSNTFAQRNQTPNFNASNNSGFSDNSFGQNDSFGRNFQNKPSLLGTPQASQNQGPSSDDILKEIGKVFLNNVTAGGNVMNMMQGNQGPPPFGGQQPGFYNNGRPVFTNFRGGYNPRGNRGGGVNLRGRGGPNIGRGGVQMARGGANMLRGGMKSIRGNQSFKAKNNPKFNNNKYQEYRALKFNLDQVHKSVDVNVRPCVAFLRQTFFDVYADDKAQFLSMGRVVLKNPNVLKLLAYEVKKGLDKKFGESETDEIKKKKLEFLTEKKAKFVEAYKKQIKAPKEEFEAKEKVIDDYISILTGENFTDEHIPKPEEYASDPNRTEAEFVLDFQLAFVKGFYEKLNFKILESTQPTKNVEKRVDFHMKNGFMPFVLVEKAKGKTSVKLPPVLNKYVKAHENIPLSLQKAAAAQKVAYDAMEKLGEQMKTDISDYIQNEKLSAEVLRDFAAVIILFDKIGTAIKFRLVKCSAFINLSEEHKNKLFNELVKSIYTDALNILKSDIKFLEKTYVDMEKDETPEPVKDESVKDESAKEDVKTEAK